MRTGDYAALRVRHDEISRKSLVPTPVSRPPEKWSRANVLTAAFISFPGDQGFATILTCAMCVVVEFALFYIILLFLRYYIPGRTHAYQVLGRFIGALISPFAATLFSLTFCHYFPLDPTATTVVFIVFIVLSIATALSIYRSHP